MQGDDPRNRGDLDWAISCYTEAIKLDPKWYGYYSKRGEVYEETNKHDKAIADFTEAIRRFDPAGDPGLPLAYYRRGLVYRAWRQKEGRGRLYRGRETWVRSRKAQLSARETKGIVQFLPRVLDFIPYSSVISRPMPPSCPRIP